MIRAMRRQAPVILAVALVGVSLVATAQVVISNVPAPVVATFPEVKVFVYTTLAAVLTTVILITGSIAAFVMSRDHTSDTEARAALAAAIVADHKVREAQFAVIESSVRSVNGSVEALIEIMKEHKRDPFAHPAASHENHRTLEERIGKLATEMDEHVQFCRTHQCAMGTRDPHDSPHPRRFTDSQEFNAAELELRGPKP
ncbi:MAG: hypothetical protein Q8P41_31590 [Pseudomonadota bacterium]|nr:hypothetical protein [Pseudomonadota bacterium]